MDEEFHKRQLQHFCRVCGGRLAKHGKRFEYSCTAHTSDLSSVFGVQIGSDSPHIHPPSFCKPCYAKLQQVRSATKKGIRYTPVTNVMTWTQHDDNCEVNTII